MDTRLNIQEYSRIPRFDLRGGIALGTALVSALPEAASESVREASAEIEQSLLGLSEAWDVRGTERRESLRPYDQRLDAAWAALLGVLDGAARLPGGRERSLNAAVLRDDLFQEGLAFLAYRFDKEWAESEKKLRKIRDERLAEGIAAVVGSTDYLEEIEDAHREYGVALSITAPNEAIAPDVNLREHMDDLRSAIAEYALQLVAWGNQRGSSNYEAAKLALAPIDAARRLEARSGGSVDGGASATPGDGSTPVVSEPVVAPNPPSSATGAGPAPQGAEGTAQV